MTPRGEVIYLDTGLSFRDNLERAKAARHTRFPLCADHFDRTIGLVHIKDQELGGVAGDVASLWPVARRLAIDLWHLATGRASKRPNTWSAAVARHDS